MQRFLPFDDFELQVLQKALAEFQSTSSPAGPGRLADREEKAVAGDLYQEARGEQRQRRAALASGLGGGTPSAARVAGTDEAGPSDG